MNNMKDPVFSITDAVKVSGVGLSTIQNWLRREPTLANSAKSSKGVTRYFTGYEVIRLRLMARLVKLSIPPKVASGIAGAVVGLFEKGHEAYTEPGSPQSLLVLFPRSAWPKGLPPVSGFAAGDYRAGWIVEGSNSASNLYAILNKVGEAPVVVLNLGAFQRESIAAIEAVGSDHKTL